MKLEKLPFEVVAAARHVLGESSTWCVQRQLLWWIDIRAGQVNRWDSSTGCTKSWTVPELCGAVVTTMGAEVIVALRAGIHSLDPQTGELSLLVTLETGQSEHRLNEAKCDRQGRLWCGSMWDFGKHPTGGLYRITPEFVTNKVRSGVSIPNGLGFSPDGRRMFFVDTVTGCIESALYDTDTGTPGPWSTLVQVDVAPGRPDGNAVDAAGCIWSTRFGAGCIARFTPYGKLDRLIHLPVSQPTSCTFGGANLDTLFITSATQWLTPEALTDEPLAGAVLALQPGVQGIADPVFGWSATKRFFN
jgi:sugar lactone lactonase YvrE